MPGIWLPGWPAYGPFPYFATVALTATWVIALYGGLPVISTLPWERMPFLVAYYVANPVIFAFCAQWARGRAIRPQRLEVTYASLPPDGTSVAPWIAGQVFGPSAGARLGLLFCLGVLTLVISLTGTMVDVLLHREADLYGLVEAWVLAASMGLLGTFLLTMLPFLWNPDLVRADGSTRTDGP